jgi:methionine-gamma-lyase
MSKREFAPESLMMSFGYKPALSEGALKCPIFQTSTFVFKNAQEGKSFFELAYGLREANTGEESGLIYSRLNNPDLEILENRLCLWDKTEDCAVFESGMSAITTVMLSYLQPGDIILYTAPLYGGTDHFVKHVLPKFKIEAVAVNKNEDLNNVLDKLKQENRLQKIALIYIETPANPTNELFDIAAFANVAKQLSTDERKVISVVDNTYLGPLWQNPKKFGADIIVYSATKYIGGHSDLIAGAVLGDKAEILKVKAMRTFLGNMAGPWTGWLLLRSLETLKIRMDKQAENAIHVADYFKNHPKIEKIRFLSHISEEKNPEQYRIFKKQCNTAGAMISLYVNGGENEAFTFLNNLKLIKLAVSLGSTESLAQHPDTMTHAGMDVNEKIHLGITSNLVRISVGVEHSDDIIWDIEQALEKINT